MNAILAFLSGPEWQHLALALLHTLWQGLAAAAALGLLLRRIPAHRPEARYWTAFSALMGLLLCGLVTWSVLDLDWPQSAASVSYIDGKTGGLPAADHEHWQDARVNHSGHEQDARANQYGQDAHAIPSQHGEGASAILTFLLSAWLMGVALMMVRMVWMVARLRCFVGGPEVTDNRIRQWIDELRQALRVTRTLRIVETAEEFGPAVLGIVRPILALPISMMTGLPPEAVRAIVAHELAHIRRHDYLLNLVQMVIEAVLFFNPAVWWINRQIRIEREACCDAMAARVLGQPLVLAESLALWAERVREKGTGPICRDGPKGAAHKLDLSPFPAFSRSGRHGPRLLLDRVLRIVLPGYRPQAPLSPLGSVGLFLAGIVALGVLSCGMSAMVELAAKALTPAQRMERIVETQKQFVPSSIASTGKITLSGTVRTKDGKAVPKKILGHFYTQSGNNSTGSTFLVQPPKFSVVVPVGESRLAIVAEGYAPAIVGPFVGKAGETISGIEAVLGQGFPLTVHVMDEKGQPVEGATVSGSIDNIVGPGQQVTDAKGTAVFANAVEGKYVFSANKPGFELFYSERILIKRDQASVTLTPRRTPPVRGVIRSADGRPVVGAEIREFYSVGKNSSWSSTATQGNVLATTDQEGRFVLDQLYSDRRYCLLIATKEHGRQLLDDISVNSKDLQVTLGPELTVAGEIRGDLKKLPQDRGKPVIRCQQRAKLKVTGGLDASVGSVQAVVEPLDGGGKFVARGLLPGLVSIAAGEHKVQTEVSVQQPLARVVIDLTKPPARPVTRQVVMRFATPGGSVSPKGKVYVQINTALGDEWREQESKEFAVVDGEIRVDVVAPAMLSYQPRTVIGYWFQGRSVRVEPGDKPLVIEVPVLAAGAIAGRVLKSDGTPVTENIGISVHGKLKTPESTTEGGFGDVLIDRGKFFISPLPLAGSYAITASVGHNLQVAGPIQLDDAHPTLNVNLQLPPTTNVSGTVVDTAGTPLARFPFDVAFSDPRNKLSHRWSDITTDQQGKFRIDDLSAEIGEYFLVFKPRKDYRPMRFSVSRNGEPVTIRIERGYVLEGHVLDEKTGWPIAGVEVYAFPQPFSADATICEAEAATDRQGRFRFSNLENRPYQFNAREVASVKIPDNDRTRRPGKEPLVLRVTLPKWSKLQPQPGN